MQAATFLTEFHQETSVPAVMDEAQLKRLVHHPFALARQWIKEEDRFDFAELKKNVEVHLRGRSIPLIWSHGDFTYDNLVVNKTSADPIGIIDWDHSQEQALPLIDLLYFLHHDKMRRQKESLAEVIYQRLFASQYSEFEKQMIDSYCRQVGVSMELVETLTILSWVHHLGYRFEHLENYRFPDLIDWGVGRVLREARKRKENPSSILLDLDAPVVTNVFGE